MYAQGVLLYALVITVPGLLEGVLLYARGVLLYAPVVTVPCLLEGVYGRLYATV